VDFKFKWFEIEIAPKAKQTSLKPTTIERKQCLICLLFEEESCHQYYRDIDVDLQTEQKSAGKIERQIVL